MSLAVRRVLARRDELMKRLEMMQAEDFAGEGADVAVEAIVSEMEHLIGLLQRLNLEAIAKSHGIDPSSS